MPMSFSETTPNRLLLVTVAARRYALPVSEVESVVSLRRADIGSVPFDASGAIRGIFMDHGGVVPLVHREGLTAASDADGSETLTAVILREKDRRLALLVDQAEKVAPASSDAAAPVLNARMLYTGEMNHGDNRRQ